MARAGPRKTNAYSLEFKLKAVKLSQLPGVEVQAVAKALEIHPFMLSKWRKEARDGTLRGRASLATVKKPPAPSARTLRQFQALQRAHVVLQEEHALLKELIRFASEGKQRELEGHPRERLQAQGAGTIALSGRAWAVRGLVAE